MANITVSMEWEVGEDFRYRITASEEVPAGGVTGTRQYLHDLCRRHRQAVEAAIGAYHQHALHQSTADYNAEAAARDLAKAKVAKQKGHDGPAQQYCAAAARSQAIADEAQAEADAIEVDENWLP